MSYRRAQYLEPDRRLLAFGFALSMHIAVLLFWTHLKHAPETPPVLFEIRLTQPAAKSEAPSIEPSISPPEPKVSQTKPTPVKPAQIKPSQPVLMAKELPDHQSDFVVPSNSPQSQQESLTTDTAIATPTPTEAKADANKSQSASQNKHSEEVEPTEAWSGYGQMLYDMVSKNKTYPAIAVRRNWEGRVKILARFEQGKLMSATILESGSGHQVLDDAALEMLRKAVNALPVRGNLANKIFTVVIPLDFKLEG